MKSTWSALGVASSSLAIDHAIDARVVLVDLDVAADEVDRRAAHGRARRIWPMVSE